MAHTQSNRHAGILAIFIALLAFPPASASGQQQETYEGFVTGIRANAIKGEVFYEHDGGKFELVSGNILEAGNFIKTGSNSYAELLLQPGKYLRIGAESECQILNDQHDKMRLKLNRGAMSVEIIGRDGEDSAGFVESMDQIYELIRIITPNAEVFLTRPGVFRINSRGNENTDVIVRHGELVINGRRVKEKRSATASKDAVTIAEINTKIEDSFDQWSRERADELVRANRALKKEAPWTIKRKDDEDPPVDLPEDDTPSNKSRYVVSAKPGAVDFVEDGVEFSRREKEWEPVTENSQLEAGDRIRTARYSFAELSMLPDIILRVDGASEMLFEKLSNDSISLKLMRGSAILDVARFDRKEGPEITLVGARTSVVVDDRGNYRIDIKPAGDEIMVRDGKVIFEGRSVGSCRKISGGTVSECDKRTDNFDFWSEHRGEGELYDGRDTVSMVGHLDRLRRLRFRNAGFWFQNPGKTDYTFVPFHSSLFRSPYGGNYSTVLSPRRMPVIRLDKDGRPRPFARPGPITRPPQP